MPDDIPQSDFLLKALAKHANDVVLVTRADKIDQPHGPQIVYCNEAFERMTGWSSAEVIGKTPRILQTPDTNRTELAKIRAALTAWNAGDESVEARVELLNRRKDGEPFLGRDPDVSRSETTITNTVIWVSLQRDVTDRVERERLVHNALEATEQAKVLQEKFLAHMSHEVEHL